MKRRRINKRRSVRTFKKHTRRTKAANVRAAPMRGGYRI